MDVIQKIHNLYPEMTRKQKSIADILLESPEDIAYITLANLSQKTSSSELTLLRFCQKLGYSNFLEMKAAFREYTQSMVKLLSSPTVFCSGCYYHRCGRKIRTSPSNLPGRSGSQPALFLFPGSSFYYLCCRSDPRRKTHLYLRS